MSAKILRAFLATGALAAFAAASQGCVADRPSRNGVFNENQYVRKDFLVRPGDGSRPDSGWFMKATIVSSSTPNPLAGSSIQAGIANNGTLVRFDVTQDKLRMLNVREIGSTDPNVQKTIDDQKTRDPEVVNAWPVTNVDLKYRINLDGEKTNYYEENQELDWQQRQWVKLQLNKNDMSDLAPFLGFGFQDLVEQCTDQGNSSVTLVPDSFFVDEKNDYMAWKVNMTFPLKFSDAACKEMYGAAGDAFQKLGRSTVNYTLMFSMMRAKPLDQVTYVPFELSEKDTIRRKYGTLDFTSIARDPASGLLGARQFVTRHDPNQPIVYYFAPGFPAEYKQFFTAQGGIVDQTNQILKDAGATAVMSVKEFDDPEGLLESSDGQKHPREYGDVRYHWLRWITDIDTQTSNVLAFTQEWADPRTGQNLSANVVFFNWEFLDAVKARLDFYLQQIGAYPATNPDGSWVEGPQGCKDGDTMPLVVQDTDPTKPTLQSRNSHSTLYAKMQEYLNKPVSKWGNLSPADFVVKQDKDFYDAFFAVVPYQVYADPAANQFVTPEGGDAAYGGGAQILARTAKEAELHQIFADLDKGIQPFDPTPGPNSITASNAFTDHMRDLSVNHRELALARQYALGRRGIHEDTWDMYNFIDVFLKDARHCINGHWETRDEYEKNLANSYFAQTVWHEMGHSMGLDHNWFGSLDRYNFPHYKDQTGRDHVGGYSSSLMDYNMSPDRVFWANESGHQGWYPYDRAAIGFIYSNAQTKDFPPADQRKGCSPATECTFSGQAKTGPNAKSFPAPYKDPYGFNGDGSERPFLNCNDKHTKFTPLCQPFDFGTSPSEIIASQIDNYEWLYQWRNFRKYRKFWNLGNYGDTPLGLVTSMRRFLSQWLYDWAGGELNDTMRRIGVTPPQGVPAQNYYSQLNDKFNRDISTANQLVAAFNKAIIQQSSGERPFKTVYDNYFGDVTQQGIFLDKYLALQSFLDLWVIDNYDPDQSAGAYLSSFSNFQADGAYNAVGQDTADSMVGGQFDTYAFLRLTAVAMFSKTTHDLNFAGLINSRDWIGGHVFYREQDFLDYFRGLAVQTNTYCTDTEDLQTCKYDPRQRRLGADDPGHSDDFNEFRGPDNRRWAWVYVQDRNAWVAVDRDRNTASYQIVRNYNNQVIHGEDASVGPFFVQLQVKYFLDSFNQYN
jgi:hypothetical protein